jgi:hypothetical protein
MSISGADSPVYQCTVKNMLSDVTICHKTLHHFEVPPCRNKVSTAYRTTNLNFNLAYVHCAADFKLGKCRLASALTLLAGPDVRLSCQDGLRSTPSVPRTSLGFKWARKKKIHSQASVRIFVPHGTILLETSSKSPYAYQRWDQQLTTT